MKPSIKELKGIHNGSPIVVIGGGPSVLKDLDKIPLEQFYKCIFISVNQHAWKADIKPDYMVFMDSPRHRDYLMRFIEIARLIGVTKIGPRQVGEWTDYDLDVDYWFNDWSSSIATWLACYMTDQDVILLGMDCYQGDKKFFHNDEDTAPPQGTHTLKLDEYLKSWKGIDRCERPERIKVISGPLKQILSDYE